MIRDLIYNSDIAEIRKRMEKQSINQLELELLQHEGLRERKVQFAGKRLFENLGKEFEMKGIGSILFFQIDNGANYSTAGEKIIKWQTGTIAAMSDTGILVYSVKKNQGKAWFCEFKRIGTKDEIEGNTRTKSGLKTYRHFQKQVLMREKLIKMGFSAHITNNTVYCKKVICKEIMDFINQ